MKIKIRDKEVTVYWSYEKTVHEKDPGEGRMTRETIYHGKVTAIADFGPQDRYSATVNTCKTKFPSKTRSLVIGNTRITLEENLHNDCFNKNKGRKESLKALLEMLRTNNIKLTREEREAFWAAYKNSRGGRWEGKSKNGLITLSDAPISELVNH